MEFSKPPEMEFIHGKTLFLQPSAKSKMAARGAKMARGGRGCLERGLPKGYWMLQTTFYQKNEKNLYWRKKQDEKGVEKVLYHGGMALSGSHEFRGGG